MLLSLTFTKIRRKNHSEQTTICIGKRCKNVFMDTSLFIKTTIAFVQIAFTIQNKKI